MAEQLRTLKDIRFEIPSNDTELSLGNSYIKMVLREEARKWRDKLNKFQDTDEFHNMEYGKHELSKFRDWQNDNFNEVVAFIEHFFNLKEK